MLPSVYLCASVALCETTSVAMATEFTIGIDVVHEQV